MGDILLEVSAVTLTAGKEGLYAQNGYGDRPFDNFSRSMMNCLGQDFDTVMNVRLCCGLCINCRCRHCLAHLDRSAAWFLYLSHPHSPPHSMALSLYSMHNACLCASTCAGVIGQDQPQPAFFLVPVLILGRRRAD